MDFRAVCRRRRENGPSRRVPERWISQGNPAEHVAGVREVAHDRPPTPLPQQGQNLREVASATTPRKATEIPSPVPGNRSGLPGRRQVSTGLRNSVPCLGQHSISLSGNPLSRQQSAVLLTRPDLPVGGRYGVSSQSRALWGPFLPRARICRREKSASDSAAGDASRPHQSVGSMRVKRSVVFHEGLSRSVAARACGQPRSRVISIGSSIRGGFHRVV